MKIKALAVAAVLLLAASAHANSVMVAGWDSSAWLPGFLSQDGATFQGTDDANFSDLDDQLVAGLGQASNQYGTMYVDGSFGSNDAVSDGSINPASGDLVSNKDRPNVGGLMSDLSTQGGLQVDGQLLYNQIAMAALSASTAVFQATLAPAGLLGSNWELTLGARTVGGAATIGVRVSTDGGSSFGALTTLNINDIDTKYTVNLPGIGLEQIFVALDFGSENNTLFDNVALSADLAAGPEPATALLALVGMAGLLTAGRRR
jgi:hypothetical protein